YARSLPTREWFRSLDRDCNHHPLGLGISRRVLRGSRQRLLPDPRRLALAASHPKAHHRTDMGGLVNRRGPSYTDRPRGRGYRRPSAAERRGAGSALVGRHASWREGIPRTPLPDVRDVKPVGTMKPAAVAEPVKGRSIYAKAPTFQVR